MNGAGERGISLPYTVMHVCGLKGCILQNNENDHHARCVAVQLERNGQLLFAMVIHCRRGKGETFAFMYMHTNYSNSDKFGLCASFRCIKILASKFKGGYSALWA